MEMSGIPFGTTDWVTVEKTEHKGEEGVAHWRTRQFDRIRVRMVEYTPGYLADHWCQKGHVLLVLDASAGYGMGTPLVQWAFRANFDLRRKRIHRRLAFFKCQRLGHGKILQLFSKQQRSLPLSD